MFCGLFVYETWITTANVYFTFKHHFNKSLIMSYKVKAVYTKFYFNEFVFIYFGSQNFPLIVISAKIFSLSFSAITRIYYMVLYLPCVKRTSWHKFHQCCMCQMWPVGGASNRCHTPPAAAGAAPLLHQAQCLH